MNITKETLQKKLSEYSAERDSFLRQADQLQKARTECVDNANTAHGAVVATQNLLAELEKAENAPKPAKKPAKSDKGSKS